MPPATYTQLPKLILGNKVYQVGGKKGELV